MMEHLREYSSKNRTLFNRFEVHHFLLPASAVHPQHKA